MLLVLISATQQMYVYIGEIFPTYIRVKGIAVGLISIVRLLLHLETSYRIIFS
jgi:hypothetical protein